MGAVSELIAREIGGQFVSEFDTVNVAVALGTVLKNDPERCAWLVVNTGAVDAQLTWQRPGGLSNSILVPANGGSLTLTWRDDFILPTYELLANVAAGATTLMIVLVRRVNT